jgi:hypothetical protein
LLKVFPRIKHLNLDYETVDVSVLEHLSNPEFILSLAIDDPQLRFILNPTSPFKHLTNIKTNIHKHLFEFQESMRETSKQLNSIELTGFDSVLNTFASLNQLAEKQIKSLEKININFHQIECPPLNHVTKWIYSSIHRFISHSQVLKDLSIDMPSECRDYYLDMNFLYKATYLKRFKFSGYMLNVKPSSVSFQSTFRDQLWHLLSTRTNFDPIVNALKSHNSLEELSIIILPSPRTKPIMFFSFLRDLVHAALSSLKLRFLNIDVTLSYMHFGPKVNIHGFLKELQEVLAPLCRKQDFFLNGIPIKEFIVTTANLGKIVSVSNRQTGAAFRLSF